MENFCQIYYIYYQIIIVYKNKLFILDFFVITKAENKNKNK